MVSKKLLIAIALVAVYVLSPIDLIPLNPIDDIIVALAGAYFGLKG